LVCERGLIPRYAQTIFFAGNFFGVLASGPVGDIFGRKLCYCLFLTLWVVFGVAGSQTSSLAIWLVCRFVCGATSLGYNNVLSVYNTELTSGKWRAKQGYFFAV